MPKLVTRALTAKFVARAPAPSDGKTARHADALARGLCLAISPSGARRWVLRTTFRGARVDVGLGPVDLTPRDPAAAPVQGDCLTLAEARELAIDLRRKAKRGIDPRQKAPTGIPTFAEAADAKIDLLRPSWKSGAGTEDDWRSTLAAYCKPINNKPVNKIADSDVIAILKAIWEKRNPTARAVRRRMREVFDWAMSEGHCAANPAAKHIDAALPKVAGEGEHHSALHHTKVGAFLAKLRAAEPTPALLATEFVVLTATRSGAVRCATWDEFDTGAKVWTIPAGRKEAKTKVDRQVPLSSRCMEILDAARAFGGAKGLVFPGRRGDNELATLTLRKVLRRFGIDDDVHGFRSSFSDWGRETEKDTELVEHALWHVFGTRTSRAYARSNLLDRRRALMAEWETYLAG